MLDHIKKFPSSSRVPSDSFLLSIVFANIHYNFCCYCLHFSSDDQFSSPDAKRYVRMHIRVEGTFLMNAVIPMIQ